MAWLVREGWFLLLSVASIVCLRGLQKALNVGRAVGLLAKLRSPAGSLGESLVEESPVVSPGADEVVDAAPAEATVHLAASSNPTLKVPRAS